MPPPVEAPPLQLADILAMLRRRRVVALIAAIAAAAAVFALPILALSALYRAEATLTMDRGLKPVEFQRDPAVGQVPDQMVNTQRELLLSKGVLQDALTMGGLLSNPAYAGNPDPVALLQKRLRAQVVRNTWVINATLDDEDPVRAEQGLRAVLDAFLAHQATQARERSAQDTAFIEAELALAAGKLQAARDAERRFREEHRIASVDPDSNHITVRIKTLAERQAALDDRLAASGALVRQMRAADVLADRQQRMAAYLRIDTISTISLVGSLQKELFEQQALEAELAQKYLDKHPRLIEVRSRIAAIRGQLEETLNATRAAIESDLQVLTEQRTALVRAQEELQGELNQYRQSLVELQRLSLESSAQQKVHDEMQVKRAQLAAMAGYDAQRMVIDGQPRSSPVASRIGSMPLAMLAAIAAAAAAIASASLADSVDRTVRGGRQLQELLGLRSLGVIPRIGQMQPICSSGPADPAELAEALRGVSTALRYALGAGEGGRVVLIASAAAGDGRSTLAARLAAGLAAAGQRVLLIDADLRRPTQAAQFGQALGNGLSQLLAGMPDLAPGPTGIPNLDLMPAGPPPGNPGELLSSHCLPEWLAQVREHYDLVLMDSPALAACADAASLAGHADALLILARAGATERGVLLAAWEQLTPVHAKAIGSILIQAESVRNA